MVNLIATLTTQLNRLCLKDKWKYISIKATAPLLLAISMLMILSLRAAAQFTFPQIASINPTSAPKRDAFTLTITGAGFLSSDIFQQGTNPGAVIFSTGIQPLKIPAALVVTGDNGVMTVQVPADALFNAGLFGDVSVSVQWCQAVPGGCLSPNALILSVPPQCTASLPPPFGTSTLIDPVPDLLSRDGKITDDPTALSDLSKGRAVNGIAADGVAKLLVRIPTCNPGDKVTITILNDQQHSSVSIDEDGELDSLGSDPSGLSQITVTANDDVFNPMAFVVFKAPVDFPRLNSDIDKFIGERPVNLQMDFDSLPGQEFFTHISIVRPPIVFVHGLWGSKEDWKEFTLTANNSTENLFARFVNYDQRIPVDRTEPPLEQTGLSFIRANSLGLMFNSPGVLQRIAETISEFNDSRNVASVQADIVAHSMGGLIVRSLPLLGDEFYSNETYNRGTIHKLITLDTPHLGTPLAQQLLSPTNTCIRNLIAYTGSSAFQSAFAGGTTIPGAVGDLVGDGFGNKLSDAVLNIQSFGSIPIPTAFVGGIMTDENLNGLVCTFCKSSVVRIVFRFLCPADPLPTALTPRNWPLIFGQESDAIVPINSQFAGLSGSTVVGVIHSSGTTSLGFAGPSILTVGILPDSGQNEVFNLLNEPVTTTEYFNLAP